MSKRDLSNCRAGICQSSFCHLLFFVLWIELMGKSETNTSVSPGNITTQCKFWKLLEVSRSWNSQYVHFKCPSFGFSLNWNVWKELIIQECCLTLDVFRKFCNVRLIRSRKILLGKSLWNFCFKTEITNWDAQGYIQPTLVFTLTRLRLPGEW